MSCDKIKQNAVFIYECCEGEPLPFNLNAQQLRPHIDYSRSATLSVSETHRRDLGPQ